MHRMAARRAAFMGRDISITASSWAWARGQTGDTATAGVSIASAAAAEAGTTEAATRARAETPGAGMQPIDVVRRQHASTTITGHTHRLGMVQRLTVRPTPQRRMVAANMEANIASLSV